MGKMYLIVIQNCYEDYFHDEFVWKKCQTLDEAIKCAQFPDVDDSTLVFDVKGYIRWYFPGCDSNGCVQGVDPNDWIECYQYVNVVPEDEPWGMDCYCPDPAAVYSVYKYYELNILGCVKWLEQKVVDL